MVQLVNPTSLATPVAAYSHGAVVPAGFRVLHTAGTVATRADGTIADSVGEQAADVWKALAVICAEASMTLGDTVSYTTYVVDGQDLGPVMAARDAALAGHAAASTLIVVPRLARPEWRVEIALIAAAP
jgi:enamine deaminase RidA (YjgF/YER057c/UK114 family)